MMKVRIYSRPTCRDCERVKEYLSEKGVPFEDIDILKNKPAQDEMMKKYGTHVTPVVVIGDQVMVGFNEPKINRLLSIE